MEPPSAAVQCYSAPVEVRGYENKWFTAQLAGIDLKASEVRIAFQSNVWQPRIVPVEAVRCVPKRATPGSFQPGPGDTVEVLSLGSDSTPPCWSLGVVRVVRDGLYYVNQQPDGDEGPLPSDREDTIVELDHLRAPVQPQASPEHLQDDLVECASSLTKLKTEIYEVPQSLADWLISDDGRACMKYIAVRVKLSLISVQTSLCDHPRVHLIGFAHTTARACMLLSIHVDHQLEIQSFHHRRLLALRKQQHQQQPRATTGGRSQRRAGDGRISARASGPRKTTVQRSSSSSSSTVKSAAAVASENLTDLEAPRNLVVKFATTRRLLGLTIGKGGANVKSVQDEFGVNVRIIEVSRESPTGSMVIIEGPSEPALTLARRRLEFFITKYPIESDSVQWVVGPRFSNLSALAEQTALHYARYSDTDEAGEERPCIEMCGRADEIDDAKSVIESHLLYREVFQDITAERRKIESSQHSGKDAGLGGDSGKLRHLGAARIDSRESISSETLAASTIDSIDRSSICGTLGA